MSISAKFYALIQEVQSSSLSAESKSYLSALLEDELGRELWAAEILSSNQEH